MLFSNNHELLDSLLSRSTVGYPSDSVASRMLELQIGYATHAKYGSGQNRCACWRHKC